MFLASVHLLESACVGKRETVSGNKVSWVLQSSLMLHLHPFPKMSTSFWLS